MDDSVRAALTAAVPQGEQLLSSLRQKSYEELTDLPSHYMVELHELGHRVTLAAYVDVLEHLNSDVQAVVVLSAYYNRHRSCYWSGGFRTPKRGESRTLTERELEEYI